MRTRTHLAVLFIMTCLSTAAHAERLALFAHQHSNNGEGVELSINATAMDQLRAMRDTVEITDVPLPSGEIIALNMRRFTVTNGATQFVDGAGNAINFDPKSVVLLRGEVADQPGSHAFLAISSTLVMGRIDLGSGGGYQIATASKGSSAVRIAPTSSSTMLPPGLALCGVDTTDHINLPAVEQAGGAVQQRHIEIALETDYEYYVLFNDTVAAAEYAVVLYGAISDIFQRDVDTLVTVTFVRVWDDPNDLFNEPDPIVPFRDYWEDNMQSVHRDVAQFLSGRRDLPYGGVAWLNGLCNSFSYSVVGYVLGAFPDPAGPSFNHYDIVVAAHELGHNCGTSHTHNDGVDSCNEFDAPPQRGTIMSYCSQTNSGGNANIDLRFHSVIQDNMESFIQNVGCVAIDCNSNGIDDASDIDLATSIDSNDDGIPDECQDCNDNGELDPIDIARGTSLDIDENGVPDECQPDCNSTGAPDRLDIMLGDSTDSNGNWIPDECEADCDGNGQMDYAQIQANMPLDINRNTILDSCEDCDGDGTIDLIALAGAHDMWVASHDTPGRLRRLHALTGVVADESDSGQISAAHDVVITEDGRIFVSSGLGDRIVEFDNSGAFVGDFVAQGSGGLDAPGMLALGPNGNLFVVSQIGDAVLEYDGTTGAFIGAFVQPGDAPGPFGLTFGPDGHLYVSSSNEVRRFDGSTGALIDTFVTAGNNGGLSNPRGMIFKPDGNLIVASFSTNQVLEYDGTTGAFAGQFNQNGTETALTLDGPWGIRLGPDGDVYVSRYAIPADDHDIHPHHNADDHHDDHADDDIQELHINSTRIFAFNADSGYFLRSYSLGNDTDIWTPTGFDFYPGEMTDCNINNLPDTCDIASGFSSDANRNGIPDECESLLCIGDLDGDDTVGINDLLLLLAGWGTPGTDVTGDNTTDVQDLLLMLGAWGDCF